MAFLRYSNKQRNLAESSVREPEAAIPLVLPGRTDDGRETRLYEVKTRIHHRLLERLDLGQLEVLDEDLVAKEIRQALDTLLEEESEPLNLSEKTRLIQELEFEIWVWGPWNPCSRTPASRTSS